MGKFNKILEIDVANRCVVAQPGVTNLGITHAVQGQGSTTRPTRPARSPARSAGMSPENSGGVHCLKYGLTTNNVIGIEMVTIDGEIVRLGGKHSIRRATICWASWSAPKACWESSPRSPSASCRNLRGRVRFSLASPPSKAPAIASPRDRRRDHPGGMEIMDRPAVAAAEAFVHAGYPLDCEALLIVELDGCEAEVDHLIAEVEGIAVRHGATSCRTSQSEAERLLFWAGRKAAFPAVGRISPDYYCMDGTIPRREIGRVLHQMKQMEARFGLRVANVFHAGDGNLHPLILYDANKPGELDRAEAFGSEILRLCVHVGGVLTGEHGVGVEKRDLMDTMFNEIDLNQQQRLKCAFDSDSLLNPGKVFPQLCRCAELGRMHVHAGKVAFPELPRF